MYSSSSLPAVLITAAATLAGLASCQRQDTPSPSAGSAHEPSSQAAPPPTVQPPSTPAPPAPPERPGAPHREAPPLPDPLPGKRTDLSAVVGSTLRATIADLDGDGTREIVLVDAEEVRVLTARGTLVATAAIRDGIQVLAAGDLDGDGRDEILAGWGRTREHMQTTTRLSLYRLDAKQLVEETILAPETSRHDVAEIVVMPDRASVLFAYFDSKYTVSTIVARKAAPAWEIEKLASLRMATSYAWGDVDGDGTADLLVGRVYGDTRGSDGDAFVLAPDGTQSKIPTTRGLRSIAIADTDGDGRAEVFMGDGWHQNYGTQARGQLSWARRTATTFQTELIEDTPGQYAIENIVPATIDGRTVIVAMGNRYVRVFSRTRDGWRGVTIGGEVRDIAVGDLDGEPGDEILLVGERSEIVKLRASDLGP